MAFSRGIALDKKTLDKLLDEATETNQLSVQYQGRTLILFPKGLQQDGFVSAMEIFPNPKNPHLARGIRFYNFDKKPAYVPTNRSIAEIREDAVTKYHDQQTD